MKPATLLVRRHGALVQRRGERLPLGSAHDGEGSHPEDGGGEGDAGGGGGRSGGVVGGDLGGEGDAHGV